MENSKRFCYSRRYPVVLRITQPMLRRASFLPVFPAALSGCAVLLAALLFFPLTAQAKVFDFLYTHYANREPLAAVLADFAQSGAYRAEVSRELDGTVSGRFEKVKPVDFLRGMERAFGVRWYRLG